MSLKRPDIQGLRGLAIFGVVLFHFRPDIFGNGYVGVDVFFSLSGFLMSSILAQETDLSVNVLLDFYSRRFKRIVPIYYMLLAAVSIVGGVILLEIDWNDFVYKNLTWAALFAMNWRDVLLTTGGYWREITNANLLEHTWSLAVEIQYYFVVPFIVFLHRQLEKRLGIAQKYSIAFLAFGSLLSFVLASEKWAFSALPCRVWQFLAGSLAYEITTSSVIKERTVPDTLSRHLWIFEFCLCALILCPQALEVTGLKLSVIFLTSLLLAKPAEGRSSMLCNKLVIYLGDISYLVYLIHWPVIVFAQYATDRNILTFGETALCIFLILAVSIASHHTIEPFFPHQSLLVSFATVVSCYVVFAAMLSTASVLRTALPMPPRAVYEWNAAASESTYSATHWLPRGCMRDEEAATWIAPYTTDLENHCVIHGANRSGIDVFVVGNSFGRVASKVIESSLAGNYKTIRFIVPLSCVILTPWDDSHDCKKHNTVYRTILKHWRPHLTFVLERQAPESFTPISWSSDVVTKRMREVFTYLSVHSDRVIVDGPYPVAPVRINVPRSVLRRLRFGLPLDELSQSFNDFESRYANHLGRLDLMNFTNVDRHEIAKYFKADDGQIYWYNRTSLHSYFMESYHLSAEGLDLLRPSYYEITARNLNILASTVNRTLL